MVQISLPGDGLRTQSHIPVAKSVCIWNRVARELDVLDRDMRVVFTETLAMHKTALRNGVLFLVGYRGSKVCHSRRWRNQCRRSSRFLRRHSVKDTVIAGLAAGNPADGHCSGIRLAGLYLQLSNHFPVKENDSNELSNAHQLWVMTRSWISTCISRRECFQFSPKHPLECLPKHGTPGTFVYDFADVLSTEDDRWSSIR